MRETVFFGAATGLPILFPLVAISLPQPRAAPRVVNLDSRRRDAASPAPRRMSDGTVFSSRRPPSGDDR